MAIKNYLNIKIYQLSAIKFVWTPLIPYLPSGSFFSTYNSSVFGLTMQL